MGGSFDERAQVDSVVSNGAIVGDLWRGASGGSDPGE